MAVPLTIEGVSKGFGSVHAVNQVTLKVEPGELFFLLGPSGCGKTTLLRCVAGFWEVDEGHILLGDEDITRLPPHRRGTAMVFQSYALWPHMTVWENVAFGLQMQRLPGAEVRRRVSESLEWVRMADRADNRPHQLSGGQQQRVALARAMVVRPKCLLLDEPLSNLDAKLRLEMRQDIRRICKDAGLTALYVTHDQKEALSVADRLAIMREGRIAQVGRPLEVYRRPADTFVAQFVGETNFLRARVRWRSKTEVRVQTAVGELVSTASTVGPSEEEVTVSIRPESIRLYPAPSGIPNVWRGRLHHTVYLGEVAEHRLSLPRVDEPNQNLTFKVVEINASVVARDEEASVQAWVDPADVVILEGMR